MRISRLAGTTILLAAGAFTLAACPASSLSITQNAEARPDVFTPVTATLAGPPPAPVLGSDGLYHLVYELRLTNTKPAAAELVKIQVLDADHPSRVLTSYQGAKLLDNLRTLQPRPAQSAIIPLGEGRLFYIELTFKPGHIPLALTHHFVLYGAKDPGPTTPATRLEYTVATVGLDPAPLPVLGPPLAGGNWVAANGCCNSLIIHRGSFQSVNGKLYDAQRFAIDYMRLNDQGEIVHGDPHKLTNYVDYGAKVLAVAPGTVVQILNTLDDQVPGQLPDPSSFPTLESVDGNHVILDLGNGYYAFYAHMQQGSVTVQVGDHVTRGEVLGLLGNSGNTSAPHLHFQVMTKPSGLGASGLPYVIDHFNLVGQIDIEKWENSPGVEGHWGKYFAQPKPQNDRFPLNLNIIDFPKLSGQ